MELKCKLIEKTFKDDDDKIHSYYVLAFKLSDGSDLEITVKSDKARLLKLSEKISDKDFWGSNTLPELE